MTTNYHPSKVDLALLAPMPESLPAPLPESAFDRRAALTIRQYELSQAREHNRVNAAADFERRLLVRNLRLGAVALVILAAGIWRIATAFHPGALAISLGVTGVVGWLTYPGRRSTVRHHAPPAGPAYQPTGGPAGAPGKVVIVNVNVHQS